MSIRITALRSTVRPMARVAKSATEVKRLGDNITKFPSNMSFLGKLQVKGDNLDIPVARLIDIGRFMKDHGLDEVAEHLTLGSGGHGQFLVTYEHEGMPAVQPIELVLTNQQITFKPGSDFRKRASQIGINLSNDDYTAQEQILRFVQLNDSQYAPHKNFGKLIKILRGESHNWRGEEDKKMALLALATTHMDNGYARIAGD